ncbi:MAG TPA: hypothetical protein VEE84_00520 [Burkholderiaceae bacterium]|nr:hypothetical protein [Burkholderiaceae bacterium]
MIVNLDQPLAQFKDKVKKRSDEYQNVRSASYSGRTGAERLNAAWLVALLTLVGALVWRGRGAS